MTSGSQVFAGTASGIVATTAFVPYLISTFRGETTPNRATWWILTFVGWMLAASYYSSGARQTMWQPLSYAVCPLVTAIISFKYGEGGWTRFDRICVSAAVLSAIVWWMTNSPILALLINLLIDFIGLLPTIRKSWLRPQSEDSLAWGLNLLASVINLFAVQRWEFAITIYPLYMVAGNGLIVALVYNRRPAKVAHLMKPTSGE